MMIRALDHLSRLKGAVELAEWKDPWLIEAIALMEDAHQCLQNMEAQPDMTTDPDTIDSKFISTFEDTVLNHLMPLFHVNLPHQELDTGVSRDGVKVPWENLIDLKNAMAFSNYQNRDKPDQKHVDIEVMPAADTAAVRGVRNHKIQKLENEQHLFGLSQVEDRVGIADDVFVNEVQYRQYLVGLYADDGTHLALKLAWDNEHAKVIERKLSMKNAANKKYLDYAMTLAKQVLTESLAAAPAGDKPPVAPLPLSPLQPRAVSEISSVTGRIKDLCQIPDNQETCCDGQIIQKEIDAAAHAAHDPAKKTARQQALGKVLADVQRKRPHSDAARLWSY